MRSPRVVGRYLRTRSRTQRGRSVHSRWLFFRAEQYRCGGAPGCRTPWQGGNGEGPGAVCVLFRVPGKNLGAVLISAGSAGFSPFGLCRPRGIPSGPQSCPGVGRVGDDACGEGSLCARRYATESLRKGFFSKLKMVMKEHEKGEEWDPVRRVGNPCSSLLVESYLTFVWEEQKQVRVPVNQAAPMLEHALIDLLN